MTASCITENRSLLRNSASALRPVTRFRSVLSSLIVPLTLLGVLATPGRAQNTYHGEPLTLVEDAGYWSRSAQVVDAQLRNDDLFSEGRWVTGTSGTRNRAGDHFQGVTYLTNGRFVAVHSLTTVDASETSGADPECAAIVWTEPYSYDADPSTISAQAECGILDRHHAGGIDSYSNYVVVPDWGFGGADKIVFLDFNSGRPVKLDHLTISLNNPGNAPAVGFSRRSKDRHYYLTVAEISDTGVTNVDVYRAACDLTDPSCRFTELGTMRNIFVSSSGMSLVDLADGHMALFTMYSPDGMSADFMRVTQFNVDHADLQGLPPFSPLSYPFDNSWPGENLGVTQAQTKTARPSCRWDCSVNMVNNKLYLVSIGRDVENDGEIELSIHRMDEN